MRSLLIAILAAAGSSAADPAMASALQVTPVLIEVSAPGLASTLRIRNTGAKRIEAQVRVFSWRQTQGGDELVATREVVASPPIAQIEPGKQQLVRLVRVSKTPVNAQESYRVLVDELPEVAGAGNSGVNFVIRQSIPVFFSPASARPAPLEWSVKQLGPRISVSAFNPGGRFVRISRLWLATPDGRSVSFGDGLTGYALAGSSVQWSTQGTLGPADGRNSISISAQTESGPLEATSALKPGP